VKFAPHRSLRIWKSVFPAFTPSWYCAFAHSLHGLNKVDEASKITSMISPGDAVSVEFVSVEPCEKVSTVQNVFATVLWMHWG
jgi:hypothetical protein